MQPQRPTPVFPLPDLSAVNPIPSLPPELVAEPSPKKKLSSPTMGQRPTPQQPKPGEGEGPTLRALCKAKPNG